MSKAYLSLGSNRGNRIDNLNKAANLLTKKAGEIITISSVYETEPWKMEDETDFFNQVLLLETTLTPGQLMDTIIQVEALMGRIRTQKKYEARIIDIDILLFNNQIINTPDLYVPHPLMHERRFILTPMAEIAPEHIHPVYKKTMQELLNDCEDKSRIRKVVSK